MEQTRIIFKVKIIFVHVSKLPATIVLYPSLSLPLTLEGIFSLSQLLHTITVTKVQSCCLALNHPLVDHVLDGGLSPICATTGG